MEVYGATHRKHSQVLPASQCNSSKGTLSQYDSESQHKMRSLELRLRVINKRVVDEGSVQRFHGFLCTRIINQMFENNNSGFSPKVLTEIISKIAICLEQPDA